MRRTHLRPAILVASIFVVVQTCSPAGATAGVVVYDLATDWSDASNPNGPWTYQQGSSALPEVPNFAFGGSIIFPITQPAWAPSNNDGDFLPAAFKADSVPAGVDWQVGDVVVHTTDPANGASNGPVNFLWTAPEAGTVNISGSVWRARTLAGRDNSWSLLVDGVAVSSGASIDNDGPDRSDPFLFSDGTGGTPALTQDVVAGTTIDLLLAKTADSEFGDLVGVNFTITETTAVPEPSTLGLLGLAAACGFGVTGRIKRTHRRTDYST